MTEEQITITLPVRSAVQRHIEHLQAVLTQRNAEIERLQIRVAEAESGEPNREALAREYQRGWKDCSNHLANTVGEAAMALRKVRKDANDIYYGYKDQEEGS